MRETKYPVISETVELAMAHIFSRMFLQAEEVKDDSEAYEDRLRTLFLACQAIDRLSTCCNMSRPGAVHFSIAAGNEFSKICTHIEQVIGFNPYFDKKKVKERGWSWEL